LQRPQHVPGHRILASLARHAIFSLRTRELRKQLQILLLAPEEIVVSVRVLKRR
jgi:hypothetical protein